MRKHLIRLLILPSTALIIYLALCIAPMIIPPRIDIRSVSEWKASASSDGQYMLFSLPECTEETYFSKATTLVRAEILTCEGKFFCETPTIEGTAFSRTIYTFRVKEVLYDEASVAPIEVGKTYRMYKVNYPNAVSSYSTGNDTEVLLVLNGDPIALKAINEPIYDAEGYQRDYLDRMGYELVYPKYAVIIPLENGRVLPGYVPPWIHEENWTIDELEAYFIKKIHEYN